MCTSCLPFSRRDLFKGAALLTGTLAALSSCETDSPPTTLYTLPDAYEDHLYTPTGTAPAPVKIDPKKIVVPAPIAAQRTDYGDIMPRAAWTNSPLQVRDGVPMNGVSRITLHHSGDGKPFLGESTADVIKHLQVVQQAHLQRGMIDIAYHFAVDRTGRAWQLRWLQYEGQHVRASANGTRNNEHNIGIVALGDFNLQAVTAVQRDRLINLTRLVRAKYTATIATRSAASTPARAPIVSMHGEIVSTDCPGKQLAPLITDARKRGLL